MLLTLFAPVSMFAQIGYQVALMDQSTGKPRANETVNVTVTISDNAGKTICSETSTQTTNSFGMLALQVGNAKSFDNVDWDKLPLWVSATVGGVTIGKSQILNVPVAEHAKHWGSLTPEILASNSWKCWRYSITFSKSGHFTYSYHDEEEEQFSASVSGTYHISGNTVYIDSHGSAAGSGLGDEVFIYFPETNVLVNMGRIYK